MRIVGPMLGTIGLGLGLQPLFVNFISGLMILLERQVKVGDTIEVGSSIGKVASISMRSTKVISADNVELVVPNSEFVAKRVTNRTLSEE